MSVTMRTNLLRRRSSSLHSGSTGGSGSAARRSSISQKDIDYIQNVLTVSATHWQGVKQRVDCFQRTRQVSNQLILLFMVGAPLFVHLYYPFVAHYQGRVSKASVTE